MGVAEPKPEVVVLRRCPNDRHYVGRTVAAAEPRLAIEPRTERKNAAGERFHHFELNRGIGRIAIAQLNTCRRADASVWQDYQHDQICCGLTKIAGVS